jgi:DNA-binding HxlR family transcriptional regulator
MTKLKRRSDCPINFALEIFGDKWSLLVIRDLMLKGKKTYGEFLDSEEKIATNILAGRLIMLEDAGLIKCRRDRKNKSRYNYSLTQKGIDLVPVMLEIIRWSAIHDKKTSATKEFAGRIKIDRESLIKEITNRINEENKSVSKN